MMKRHPAILISFILIFQTTFCEVRLPHLISDGMVLERNIKVNIWGWASPGEKINLLFRRKNYSAITSPVGKWKIALFPMNEGGPYSMKIDGSNHLVINDILVG